MYIWGIHQLSVHVQTPGRPQPFPPLHILANKHKTEYTIAKGHGCITESSTEAHC